MLIVLEVELELHAVYAARSVYLVYCELNAVLNCVAVNRSAACERTDAADNERVAAGAGAGAVRGASGKGNSHCRSERYRCNLSPNIFHFSFLPFLINACAAFPKNNSAAQSTAFF